MSKAQVLPGMTQNTRIEKQNKISLQLIVFFKVILYNVDKLDESRGNFPNYGLQRKYVFGGPGFFYFTKSQFPRMYLEVK